MKNVPEHTEDLELAGRILSGDRRAFEDFFSDFHPRVLRFARSRMPDTAECDDIAQQTIARAFRYLHTYKGEASLYTWVCQICRNVISTWFTQNRQRQEQVYSFDQSPELLASLESLEGGMSGSARDVDQEKIVETVQLAMDALPARYAEALRLKYLLGLSLEEIAQQCSVSNIAVQSLLARSRTAFKEAFELLSAPAIAEEVVRP